MRVGVIGGGAAGFFSAIMVKENYPDADVTIFEKTSHILSKVKISGGGRCNLTNAAPSIKELCQSYPRGESRLKKAFNIFNNKDTMKWFESRGVPLTVQNDNSVFPLSQDSQTIIDCFLKEAAIKKIQIVKGRGVNAIDQLGNKLQIHFSDIKISPEKFDKVIVATGGSPDIEGLKWLQKLNHKIESPVPSLFTFNIPDDTITDLSGIVVEKTTVTIQGTNYFSEGPLLITHWGMSGPSILKLSSFGARFLNQRGYIFNIRVNWINESNNDLIFKKLLTISEENRAKILSNFRPYLLPERLWCHLIKKSELPLNRKWGELGKRGLNKLLNTLTNDTYAVKGRTSFKEEFVTCGGISLENIDFNTMQSKVCDNLYFAGEILDIDGITGGYNLQAAWTTGFIAAKLL